MINIDGPTQNEVDFVDRHGNHSINCMFVCGANMLFYYVSANWPGSVHDARVLRNSTLAQRMENGWRPFPQAVILGDSAYPLQEWLIPPLHGNPQGQEQAEFNRRHRSTRRLIENALGILKEKFPCLKHLRLDPVFSANVVKCCATLCNISHSPEDVHHPLENEDAVEPEEVPVNAFDENEHLEGNMAHAHNRLQDLLNFFNRGRVQ